MKRRLILLFALMLTVFTGNISVKAANTTIQILEFNDFHGRLLDQGKDPGVAKLVGKINELKTANPNTLVVGGGDLFQGSPLSNLTNGDSTAQTIKNTNITASAVGNHEFDWTMDLPEKWEKAANFNFLMANVYDKGTKNVPAWAQPYQISEVGGKKIGLIGISTPETAFKTNVDNAKLYDFASVDESAKIATTHANYLRNTEKVDAVLVISHLPSFQDANGIITGEVQEFANKVQGIDAITTGHSHEKVNGTVNNIPIIQSRSYGRALGSLELTFDSAGKVNVKSDVIELTPVSATLPIDSDTKKILDDQVAQLGPILNEYITENERKLDHDRTVPNSELGEYFTDLVREYTKTDIAIMNGGGYRFPLEQGKVTNGTMYDLLPFDNTIITMKLTGAEIKKNLANGINNTSIGWINVSGIKVYYDPNASGVDKVKEVYLDFTDQGESIELMKDDQVYTVTTNDFIFSGGDTYDFTKATESVDTGKTVRDVIKQSLKNVEKIVYNDNADLMDINNTPILVAENNEEKVNLVGEATCENIINSITKNSTGFKVRIENADGTEQYKCNKVSDNKYVVYAVDKDRNVSNYAYVTLDSVPTPQPEPTPTPKPEFEETGQNNEILLLISTLVVFTAGLVRRKYLK